MSSGRKLRFQCKISSVELGTVGHLNANGMALVAGGLWLGSTSGAETDRVCNSHPKTRPKTARAKFSGLMSRSYAFDAVLVVDMVRTRKPTHATLCIPA